MMRRAFSILSLALLCGGCSMVSGTRQPDGTLVVTSWRCLWKSEAVSFTTGDTNNFTVALQLGASGTDRQALGVVTEAAVSAALKGARP